MAEGFAQYSPEDVSKCRSQVIERFINIEHIICAIITQHYFKRINGPFLFEVLCDELCSFAMKRNVLKKVINDVPSNILEDLGRCNKIRNLFAHWNMEISSGPEPTASSRVPDQRDVKKSLDFRKLFAEYAEKAARVETFLWKNYKKMGGAFVEEEREP